MSAGNAALEDAAAASAQPGKSRFLQLDALRGLALTAMVVFHATWDLDFFALLPSGSLGDGFRFAGHAIAAVFLAIVGASLALAGRNGLAIRPFFIRIGRIGAAAALVTVATFVVLPNEYIYFGILHCIVVVSLLAAPFLVLPAAAAWIGALLAVAAPLFLAGAAFNAPWIQWLGLGTTEPVTNDWAPFLPAFGYALAGLALMRTALMSKRSVALARWRPQAPPLRLAVVAGRHSLAIYLLHQPLLLGVLYGALAVAGRPLPSEASDFERSCQIQCMARGSDRAFCQRVCACIRSGSQQTAYWNHVLENKLTQSERTTFDGVIDQCYANESSP